MVQRVSFTLFPPVVISHLTMAYNQHQEIDLGTCMYGSVTSSHLDLHDTDTFKIENPCATSSVSPATSLPSVTLGKH